MMLFVYFGLIVFKYISSLTCRRCAFGIRICTPVRNTPHSWYMWSMHACEVMRACCIRWFRSTTFTSCAHFDSVVVEFAIIYFICCYCLSCCHLVAFGVVTSSTRCVCVFSKSNLDIIVQHSLPLLTQFFPRSRMLSHCFHFSSPPWHNGFCVVCGVWRDVVFLLPFHFGVNQNNGRNAAAHQNDYDLPSRVFRALWYMGQRHHTAVYGLRWNIIIIIVALNRWMRLNSVFRVWKCVTQSNT